MYLAVGWVSVKQVGISIGVSIYKQLIKSVSYKGANWDKYELVGHNT